jgi:MFS family permease
MGVLADKHSRHRILIATQTAAMIQALLLALLVLNGAATVQAVAVLAFAGGLVFAVEAPARQSFVAQIVPHKEDFSSAIALNSAVFNLARIIGPSLAGLIVAAWTEGPVFAVNAASYLAVIAALLVMKPGRQAGTQAGGSVFGDMARGVSYSMRFPSMKIILVSLSVLSVLSFSYVTMMPVFAREVLGGDARTLGFLLAAVGVGAVSGAVYVSSTTKARSLWKSLPASAAILGAGLAGFSFSRSLALSLAVLPFCGFGMIAFMTSCNTILQHVVDEKMRGRVMSFYTFAVMGTMPLGSLLSGAIAGHWSAPVSTLLGSAAALSLSVFLRLKTSALDPFESGADVEEQAGVEPPQI